MCILWKGGGVGEINSYCAYCMGKDRYLVSEIQVNCINFFVCVKGSMKCALLHNCAYHKESATTESKRVTTCLLLENIRNKWAQPSSIVDKLGLLAVCTDRELHGSRVTPLSIALAKSHSFTLPSTPTVTFLKVAFNKITN